MKILNSSTNKKSTINKNDISIYVCGPTVYNHVHIGNIRPIITFDVLNRYLLFKGANVNFIHNITDIDDKILKKAREEKVSELELSSFYNEQYKIILKKLNILDVKMPKVSENMNDIIKFVERLYNIGYAYMLNDGLYFDTSKINGYGEVSNMKIEELEDGKRININDNKKNQNDFVIWKLKDDGITWSSPFGEGRPGWHTECVVLIEKFIGGPVDIHGGGIDLRFPHHENENAQFEALHSKPLTNTWMHVGHLMINNEKMSKSIGNFILAKDIINEWGANTVRWFFYQTKYSKPLNYTHEQMYSTKQDIEKIIYELNKATSYLIINDKIENKKILPSNIDEYFKDDLNFPNIVTELQVMTKSTSNLIRNKNWNELKNVRNYILTTLDILGIIVVDIFNPETISMLKRWNDLIKDKKFKEADILREKLSFKKVL